MRRFLTRRNIIIVIGVLLVVGWIWRSRAAANKQAASAQRVVAVERGEVKSTLEVSGKVEAEQMATLNFSSTGKVAYVGVKAGDVVKKGQVMAYLDQADLNAVERKAWYTYQATDANAKMVEDEVKGHDKDETFLQKNERVAAQTARDTAYDMWLSAVRALRETKLVAPFAGVVAESSIASVGDTATVTDGITVVDTTNMYFLAEVDEAEVGELMLSKQVVVELDAYPEKSFEARIVNIGYVSQLSSTGATVYPVKLRLTVPNELVLRVGMNGDALILLEKKENVLKLPVEAVEDGEVIREGKPVQTTKVQVGLEGDTDVEIVSGLNEGDRVVVP